MTNLGNRLDEASADPAAHTELLHLAAASSQAHEAGGDTDETAAESPKLMPVDSPRVVPQPAATSVITAVEQVPSASVAFSIQRFGAGLPGVVAATTREYAAGRLRLEVMSRGAIRADDIGLWPGGRLEVVEQAKDRI